MIPISQKLVQVVIHVRQLNADLFFSKQRVIFRIKTQIEKKLRGARRRQQNWESGRPWVKLLLTFE